jgi:hypothetical protein
MQRRHRFPSAVLVAAAMTSLAAGSCSSNETKGGDNQVFFVGYVYDGATGQRLDKTALTSVAIIYGDKTIKVDISDDGRFVSRDPLPTWRDYTVKIEATGYRSFASYNTGIDVPASLAMTNGVAQAETIQTLDFSAYLFPVDLKAPKLTLTITVPDMTTGAPVTEKVDGQLRLRPQNVPSILIGGTTTSTPAKRVWANGEDLLTQTVLKSFMNGAAVIDEGEMVYGVAYELTIFGVKGYQPFVLSATGLGGGLGGTITPIVAGSVTSQTFALIPEAQDPLKIVAIDATTCMPPAPTSNSYGGKVTLTFNTDIEVVGSTLAEDIDNTFTVSPAIPAGGSTTQYCPLRSPTGDPAQERGSKVEVGMNTLAFSFNPTVGFATTSPYGACTLPPSIASIVYYTGNTSIMLQPKGNALRKRSLSSMLSEKAGTSQLACPQRN